jgi:CRP-like cAMP-binding protein
MYSVDPDSTLGRILNFIGQNLKVDKLFIDLGFDPNHFTWDAVFHRVVEIVIANITVANMLALVGAVFYVATLMMRTIVPLRVIGIISIAFFIAYGVVAGAVSTFLLYLLERPINVIGLRQMHPLEKTARTSAQGDLSMDWLRPYMTPRKYRKGDVLFRKGDVGNEMFLTVTGKFLVSEIGVEVPPGRIMGELGFVAPKNRRTQTVKCIESGDVLTITYETLLELYFQNPEFGYYLLSLTSERLLQNISRLEGLVEEYKTKLDQQQAAQVRQPGAPVPVTR